MRSARRSWSSLLDLIVNCKNEGKLQVSSKRAV
jgi:hypothetical protein